MELRIERFARKPEYTIGHLYVDGVYFCDTLEDTDRGLRQDMGVAICRAKKVYGRTAIPTGTYRVTLDVQSPRFAESKQYRFCDGFLPRLLNVPGFDGILIHIGNKAEDTDGCILVGKNKARGQVLQSAEAFRQLYEVLKNQEEILCTVV